MLQFFVLQISFLPATLASQFDDDNGQNEVQNLSAKDAPESKHLF